MNVSVDEYLESLPEVVQSQLYEAPATCLSLYRLLPPLAKFLVMSMVFSDKPVALRTLDRWIRPGAKRRQNESLKHLKLLHLLIEDRSGTHVKLQPTFRRNFRDCLTGSQKPNAFGQLGKEKIDLMFLDKFATQKWETILHFMVGTELGMKPSKSVLRLLLLGGLLESGEGGLMITKQGFQFLLQNLSAQIWTLLFQYLNLTQELNIDPVEVLNFIFVLGSLELGKSYLTKSLTETQLTILVDLKECGLVYQPPGVTESFFPTRLATTLTSESSSLKSASSAVEDVLEADGPSNFSNEGTIILETNFKLYAYTNSPLEIAIINLFVHLRSRFANMICGQITRESLRNALYSGITADQIIRFLESRAHPQMKALAREKLDKRIENSSSSADAQDNVGQPRLEVLPSNVVDQLKLWQLELDRIQTFDGYLFRDFTNQREYDILSNYATEIGVLLWSDKKRARFFVAHEGVDQVAEFADRNLRS